MPLRGAFVGGVARRAWTPRLHVELGLTYRDFAVARTNFLEGDPTCCVVGPEFERQRTRGVGARFGLGARW